MGWYRGSGWSGARQQGWTLGQSAASATTWNPTDKDANLILSNGDLTASNAGLLEWDGVRSIASKSSGKTYFEVKLDAAGNAGIGISKATAALNPYPGTDANGYGYVKSGDGVINNGVQVAAYGGYAVGDVVGIALDLSNNKLFFSKNGVWQGASNPVSNTGGIAIVSGSWFAHVGIFNSTLTANFGRSAFVSSPPTGFVPWG